MEELAIVKNVGFGMRDCTEPVLWFDVDALGVSALQVFDIEHASQIIQGARCYDIKSLEGKACVVARSGNMMEFLRWYK